MRKTLIHCQNLIKDKQHQAAFLVLNIKWINDNKKALIAKFDVEDAYDFLSLLEIAISVREVLNVELDEIDNIYNVGMTIELNYYLSLYFHYNYHKFLRDKGEYNKAYDILYAYYKEKIHFSSVSDEEIAENYIMFADDLKALKRNNEALEYYLQAEKILESKITEKKKSNLILLSDLQQKIASMFEDDYLYDRSLEYYLNENDLLLHLSKEKLLDDYSVLAKNYFKTAGVYHKLNRVDEALKSAISAKETIERLSDSNIKKEFYADILTRVVNYKYDLEGVYDKSLLLKSIELRSKLPTASEDKILPYDLLKLGDLYIKERKLELAIKTFDEALDIFINYSRTSDAYNFEMGVCYDNLAKIYRDLEQDFQYEKNHLAAIDYFQKASKKDKSRYQFFLINSSIELADRYFYQKEFFDAEMIYNIAATNLGDLATKNPEKYGGKYAYVYQQLAEIALLEENYTSAIAFSDNSIPIYYWLIKTRFSYYVINLCKTLLVSAIAYASVNDENRAIKEYQKAIILLREASARKITNGYPTLIDFLDKVIDYCISIESYDLAVEYSEELLSLLKNDKSSQYKGLIKKIQTNLDLILNISK